MKSVEQLKAIYMFTFVPEFVTFHQKHIKLMSNDAGTTGPQDQARKEEPSQATQMVKGAPEKWRPWLITPNNFEILTKLRRAIRNFEFGCYNLNLKCLQF